MYLCHSGYFLLSTILSVNIDCSDVCASTLIHISFIFPALYIPFSTGSITCVQCKALQYIMRDCIFSFCFAQSLFWLKLTDCLAQRYVFLFCYAAHIFISQLSVVTCFRIYCILAVIVNFPVDYFFCHFCLRLTCTFGSHLQVAVTPVGRGFPYHTYIRYTVNDFSGYIEDICSYAHLTEGILNCLEKKGRQCMNGYGYY